MIKQHLHDEYRKLNMRIVTSKEATAVGETCKAREAENAYAAEAAGGDVVMEDASGDVVMEDALVERKDSFKSMPNENDGEENLFVLEDRTEVQLDLDGMDLSRYSTTTNVRDLDEIVKRKPQELFGSYDYYKSTAGKRDALFPGMFDQIMHDDDEFDEEVIKFEQDE